MAVTKVLAQPELFWDNLVLPKYRCPTRIQAIRDHMKEVIESARERKKIPTFTHIPWASLKNLDFSFMDLRGVDFRGLDLSYTLCVGTYFNHALLNNTNFYGSSFRFCSFLYAECKGANFTDCYLRRIMHTHNLPIPSYSAIFIN